MRWFAAAVLLFFVSQSVQAGDFTLRSTDIEPDQKIGMEYVYKGFGCSGGNASPELHWSGAPADTKSFAITAYDPDAPTGSGWWHWVVYNIPADVQALPTGASAGDMPAGAVQGRTDFGTHGYGGPCPPEGDKAHRYIFTVFALDVPELKLPKDASAAMVGFNLNAHALTKAHFQSLYSR